MSELKLGICGAALELPFTPSQADCTEKAACSFRSRNRYVLLESPHGPAFTLNLLLDFPELAPSFVDCGHEALSLSRFVILSISSMVLSITSSLLRLSATLYSCICLIISAIWSETSRGWMRDCPLSPPFAPLRTGSLFPVRKDRASLFPKSETFIWLSSDEFAIMLLQ